MHGTHAVYSTAISFEKNPYKWPNDISLIDNLSIKLGK
jgi:hypothetical protein